MIDRRPQVLTERSRRRQVAVVLILALVIGAAAGMLSLAAGNNVPSAVLTGGAAFAGSVGLLLALARFAGDRN
ncbi:hypothetical protein [Symbioplanes lichenis]|uniref:hypothetical protein n=1 Tax=Symbioplanes lichenis TaxID=1629072 RepID=UPI00273A0577|nr:hypothetical protein [Actinoplanes lichenis]